MDNKWSSISAGYFHTAALKSNGTLWAWGGNEVGQLGDGTSTERHSPVQTNIESNWTKVAAGYFHTTALKSNGTLWTWGLNEYGQLGDGSTIGKYFSTQTDPIALSKNLP
jgi:alpha-tubulin suppressor-like RCC1 family protein